MPRPRRATCPNRLTLGIDEAGRGPAIGPMVVAAVALDSRLAAALTRKGLRDSKAYGAGPDAHAIRSELAALGVELLDTPQEVIPAALAYLGIDPTSREPGDLDEPS